MRIDVAVPVVLAPPIGIRVLLTMITRLRPTTSILEPCPRWPDGRTAVEDTRHLGEALKQ
jgi:hypothetical protein